MKTWKAWSFARTRRLQRSCNFPSNNNVKIFTRDSPRARARGKDTWSIPWRKTEVCTSYQPRTSHGAYMHAAQPPRTSLHAPARCTECTSRMAQQAEIRTARISRSHGNFLMPALIFLCLRARAELRQKVGARAVSCTRASASAP